MRFRRSQPRAVYSVCDAEQAVWEGEPALDDPPAAEAARSEASMVGGGRRQGDADWPTFPALQTSPPTTMRALYGAAIVLLVAGLLIAGMVMILGGGSQRSPRAATARRLGAATRKSFVARIARPAVSLIGQGRTQPAARRRSETTTRQADRKLDRPGEWEASVPVLARASRGPLAPQPVSDVRGCVPAELEFGFER